MDPLGYAAGDPDLYGYCLDDPVNMVDPSGLSPTTDWIVDRYDETVARRMVWIWNAKPGSCKMCQELNGTMYDDIDDAPPRPHPNCKCELLQRLYKLEFSDWEIIAKGKPKYHVAAILCFGAICKAAWKKTIMVKEKRKRLHVIYSKTERMVVKETTEFRKRQSIETMRSNAMAWNGGGNIEEPDYWSSINPWTGKATIQRVPPGP
jgi:hypothetical protein